MGIEPRPKVKRKRVFEAEQPHLVRITPTAERIMHIIETDLNPEHFTFGELHNYCTDGDRGSFEYDDFGLDDLRLRIGMRKLTEAGFIERSPGKEISWRITQAAAIEFHAPLEDLTSFEERDGL